MDIPLFWASLPMLTFCVSLALLCAEAHAHQFSKFIDVQGDRDALFGQSDKYWHNYVKQFAQHSLLKGLGHSQKSSVCQLHHRQYSLSLLFLIYRREVIFNRLSGHINEKITWTFSMNTFSNRLQCSRNQNCVPSTKPPFYGKLKKLRYCKARAPNVRGQSKILCAVFGYFMQVQLHFSMHLNITVYSLFIVKFNCRDLSGLKIQNLSNKRPLHWFHGHHANFRIYPSTNSMMITLSLPCRQAFKVDMFASVLTKSMLVSGAGSLKFRHEMLKAIYKTAYSSLLYYHLEVRKGFCVQIQKSWAPWNQPWEATVADGPGMESPTFIVSQYVHACSTFQCILLVRKASFFGRALFNYIAKPVSVTQGFTIVNSVPFNMPTKHMGDQKPSLFVSLLLQTTNSNHINVTITEMNYRGKSVPGLCRYGGITALWYLPFYEEKNTLCTNHSFTAGLSRAFYSVHSYLYLVIFQYSGYSDIEATLIFSPTNCSVSQHVIIDHCAVNNVNLSAGVCAIFQFFNTEQNKFVYSCHFCAQECTHVCLQACRLIFDVPQIRFSSNYIISGLLAEPISLGSNMVKTKDYLEIRGLQASDTFKQTLPSVWVCHTFHPQNMFQCEPNDHDSTTFYIEAQSSKHLQLALVAFPNTHTWMDIIVRTKSLAGSSPFMSQSATVKPNSFTKIEIRKIPEIHGHNSLVFEAKLQDKNLSYQNILLAIQASCFLKKCGPVQPPHTFTTTLEVLHQTQQKAISLYCAAYTDFHQGEYKNVGLQTNKHTLDVQILFIPQDVDMLVKKNTHVFISDCKAQCVRSNKCYDYFWDGPSTLSLITHNTKISWKQASTHCQAKQTNLPFFTSKADLNGFLMWLRFVVDSLLGATYIGLTVHKVSDKLVALLLHGGLGCKL